MSRGHHSRKTRYSPEPVVSFLKAKEPEVLEELDLKTVDDMTEFALEYLSKGVSSREAIKQIKKKLREIRKCLGITPVVQCPPSTKVKNYNTSKYSRKKNKYSRKFQSAFICSSSEDFYTILDGIK